MEIRDHEEGFIGGPFFSELSDFAPLSDRHVASFGFALCKFLGIRLSACEGQGFYRRGEGSAPNSPPARSSLGFGGL